MVQHRRSDADVEIVLPSRARLGESPVWCPRSDRLYWIDIDGRALHRTDVSNGRDDVTDFDVRPGSIALREDVDHLLVAAEHSLFDLDLTTGALQDLVRLESASSPTRMNDGRCDPAGRFWVGSMDDPGDSGKNAAQLHCIGADLSVTAMEHRVGVSNSLAFDAASNTMYWADTRQGVIWAYDYDVDAGSRSNQRILIDFEGNLPGAPDGACVDAEGCLWVACVYGWSVARISPRGTVDCVLELPVEKPSMPAFGGRGLDTMYVTSISTGGSRPAAPDQPLAGALLAIDVGVSGLPEPAFAG